ncbi:hypothetical protein FOC29_03450 [Burkholderia vietnamiensis]|uniref:hypothetical protein n=1 Tax=Burkholderia vietnamiensis TaxID=60552 RepID=UPI001EE5A734|nr:hypothetical protein [Burkholderia vietnamiensis]UKV72874.1 hypothetical protein FOC29_03450 [Burkholderia vietnamiensis]
MKPRWAYIWEYTHVESQERRRTRLPVTPGEFRPYTGQFLDESDARPLEETKVDRNVVPLREPYRRHVPMPDFAAPTESELSELWRTNRDPEVRRRILEIVALRQSLEKVMDWWRTTDSATSNRGDLDGPFGPFRKLYHMLREELRRARMN